MEEIVEIVNRAIKVYEETGIEQYPMARATDEIERLTEPNSRTRQMAYNVFEYYLNETERKEEE